MISDIMHSFGHDKGKPTEKWGRKTTGLREFSYDSGATDAMDCKPTYYSWRLFLPDACDIAACSKNNNKLHLTHLGLTR